uniref:Uncharacterized protein n=1 Tax=Strongyloides papillosus TaxID=174720 RepID=A0A0N5BCA3_STREA
MDFTLKETITLKNIESLGYVFEKAFDFAGKTDFSICHILPNLFGIKKSLMELQQSGIGESYLVSSSFIDGTSDTDEENFMEENEFGEEKSTLIQQNLLKEEFIQFKNYVIAEVESKIKYYQNDLIHVATLL